MIIWVSLLSYLGVLYFTLKAFVSEVTSVCDYYGIPVFNSKIFILEPGVLTIFLVFFFKPLCGIFEY